MTPHAKLAVRPYSAESIPKYIKSAYRAAYFGRPGPAFVDLPANLILGQHDIQEQRLAPLVEAPKSMAPPQQIRKVVEAIRSAKAPLIVIGKGAAYARAESQVRALVNE